MTKHQWYDSPKVVLVDALVEALAHIQSELNAAGEEEVKQHPILRDKQAFVDRWTRYLKEGL